MKRRIDGSQYADDARDRTCSHLMPIAQWLEEQGHTGIVNSRPRMRDKGDTANIFTKSSLQFDAIESEFEIPDFLIVSREHQQIVCRRCWTAIVSTAPQAD